jgi:hypothetical protein
MTEQEIVARLLAPFRPIDQHAEKLVTLGLERAEDLFLSGPHIVLAALHQQELMGALHGARNFRELADSLRQNGVPTSLQRWVDFPSDHSPSEYCTYGLITALTQVRELAGKGSISWQQLLRAIVDFDIDVITAITAAKHGVSNLNFSASLPQSWPGNSWNVGFAHSGAPETTTLPTRREATITLLYAKRHLIQIEKVLRELAMCDPNQVLVVRGLFGSPRQRLHHILADILVHPTNDLIRQDFAQFHHVLIQDVGALHAASTRAPDGAVDNLRYNLGLAQALRAILVINRGELLTDPQYQETNLQILGALLDIHHVPVVISYEDEDELQSMVQLKLPLINYREVDMEPYPYDHARPALHEYYGDYWRSLGVQVDKGALESVLRIELAIYARSAGMLKRMALPYSMADLLNETVGTIRGEVAPGGSGHLLRIALTAKQRVEALIRDHNEGRMLFTSVDALHEIARSQSEDSDLRQEARTLHEFWRPICETLASLPQRMQNLADHPQVRTGRSLYVITEDMVTAQLLSDAKYHMKLMKAFGDSVRLSEPRLLGLIELYAGR